ncbi:metallophosphoesterase family protein [Cohnella faecalis]|uniref:Metallophosphoesterase n=1 Tax=Cohnella faecalis TaxID=2315694 RepID=A0A398CBU9_9BACL|nr:metallophosphoesterase family protein [Cohnella faecalis]RIE00253.1 metallophosphoesterase [Cohnella faecalis]
MDTIAIISDVHGNIPALEAVLNDISRRKITRIFCLGDLVGKGPDSVAVVDIVKERCERIVMGNWDDLVTKPNDHEEVSWHRNILGVDRLNFLRSLPFSIEFFMSGKFIRLFHASPRSLYERIQPWDALEKRLSLCQSSVFCLEDREADVIGYGDIHNAYLQHSNGKVLFNVGSVGNPLDSVDASYAIVEGAMDEERSSAPFELRFIKVPYDIEMAVRLAVAAKVPSSEAYIKELRTGKYRGLKD